ncbi:MAG: UDP-3-O-acyl-N-acetylglucosamine deacetylase, partial [Caulobacteraceae bacterium]|nr:UDP-3-O-acyl-N-acetylglucosamine deacetylase [Caulobacter sp.]
MSSAVLQHTLASPAVCRGAGVHSGAPATLTLLPAPQGAGVVFARTDAAGCGARIPLSPAAVVDTRLHTVLGDASGVAVSTVEHVLAALAALGVDNATVELDGPETPIMDGS